MVIFVLQLPPLLSFAPAELVVQLSMTYKNMQEESIRIDKGESEEDRHDSYEKSLFLQSVLKKLCQDTNDPTLLPLGAIKKIESHLHFTSLNEENDIVKSYQLPIQNLLKAVTHDPYNQEAKESLNAKVKGFLNQGSLAEDLPEKFQNLTIFAETIFMLLDHIRQQNIT